LRGGKTPPIEYIEYLLIKNVYHCTPDELEQQNNDTTDLHLIFMNLENKKQLNDIKKQELKNKR